MKNNDWEVLYKGIKKYIDTTYNGLRELKKETIEQCEFWENDLSSLLEWTHQLTLLSDLKNRVTEFERGIFNER